MGAKCIVEVYDVHRPPGSPHVVQQPAQETWTLLQEQDVREFWEECGEVGEVDLMRFPDTGRFKGIAFITFATVGLAVSSLQDRSHGFCCFQSIASIVYAE